jgi:hypothetical protein
MVCNKYKKAMLIRLKIDVNILAYYWTLQLGWHTNY